MKCFKCGKNILSQREGFGVSYKCCDYYIHYLDRYGKDDFGFIKIISSNFVLNKFGFVLDYHSHKSIIDLNISISDPEQAYNLLKKYINNLEFA